MTIGILALQGSFFKHLEVLKQLNLNTKLIRYPDELETTDALIIPGGESTTMSRLLERNKLIKPLQDYPGPIFGTCAGAIILSKECGDNKVFNLGKVRAELKRNAYGRQIESFTARINLTFDPEPFKGVFIRAPKITRVEKQVEILGEYQNEPVLLRDGNYLLATFHPELTEDRRIHRYFLDICQESRSR